MKRKFDVNPMRSGVLLAPGGALWEDGASMQAAHPSDFPPPLHDPAFHAGDPIGSQRGLLKLMLHPLVGTVNVPDMFMDPIHLDARGNAAMAEVLAPVLEAALRPVAAEQPLPNGR